MGTYALIYTGGGMAEDPAEQQASMDAWMGWFGQLGDAVKEVGAPFAASTAVLGDGSRGEAASRASGYSVLTADSLEAAADLAKGCPILATGGAVEVFETVQM